MLGYALKRLRESSGPAAMLALAACGGGGGYGGGIGSTPPPPVVPPPPPPAVAISAPAHGTTGSAAPHVFAADGGASFTNGGAVGTTVPLLQTSLIFDEASIKPDDAVNGAGGTLTVSSMGAAVNINNVSGAPSTIYSELDWTRYGWWATSEPQGPWDYGGDMAHRGVFVAGYETPTSDMPVTGTASYSGGATGFMFVPANEVNGLPCRCLERSLGGTASFTADFGARSLSGTLTDMGVFVGWDGDTIPWNDVAFNATIAGNGFSGTTRVTNSPAGAMGLNATGTLEGRFFGPSAAEAGAVWTLFDGTNSAIGSLGGKRNGGP